MCLSTLSYIQSIHIEEVDPRASDPSPLWQQLSHCCPDLFSARGTVPICRRIPHFSVPVFQTDRYARLCVHIFFFPFSSEHTFMQAASISSLIGSENRKWDMCLSEGLWSPVCMGTFPQRVAEKNRRRRVASRLVCRRPRTLGGSL